MESAAAVVAAGQLYEAVRVIYLPPDVGAAELSVGASPGATVDNRPRIDVRKDQVPVLPAGSTIEGAMDGMPARTYRVDRVESGDPHYHHAWVSPR